MSKVSFYSIMLVVLFLSLSSSSSAAYTGGSGNSAPLYSGGDGSPAAPWQIANVADWQQLMATPADWDKNFILTANINLAGIPLTPVGNDTTMFTGIFDGQGHVIHNAVINQPKSGFVGLFGYLNSGSQIKNLGVENVNITGAHNVGSLIGKNYEGTVQSCYSTGSVTGYYWRVGGLVGCNGNDENSYCRANIFNCYSTVSVSGTGTESEYVGGLVGYNDWFGTVQSCYSTGVVSGIGFTGGLVGLNKGTISSSFWDKQTSGCTISDGGIGIPTAAMQIAETYLRAWWDFKGEFINGTEEIWTMPSDGGYPIFSWQINAASVPVNDDLDKALVIKAGDSVAGSSIGATGLDITLNGYNDCRDVWYYFVPTDSGLYTISIINSSFDATLGVFDVFNREVVFNDDFFGGQALVILKAKAGKKYYIRVAGYDGETGDFTLKVQSGAIQMIQGDLNYDGKVNLIDWAIMAQNWLLGG